MFFPPRKYTYDLPAPPTQEEVVQEAAKALGDSLRTLATNNPTYKHLSNFFGITTNVRHHQLSSKKGFRQKDSGKTKVDPTKHYMRT